MKTHNGCDKCLDANAELKPLEQGSLVLLCALCGQQMSAHLIHTPTGNQLVYFAVNEDPERVQWLCTTIMEREQHADQK